MRRAIVVFAVLSFSLLTPAIDNFCEAKKQDKLCPCVEKKPKKTRKIKRVKKTVKKPECCCRVLVIEKTVEKFAVKEARSSDVLKVVEKTMNISVKPAALPEKVEKQNAQWWWIGPGVFVLGTWAGEKDFIVGGLGKLVFAVNKRFRVAGLVGAGLGPWQESKPNILVGAEAGIRLWNWFFLNAGLETVWGGFQGLSVHRRIFFAGIGPDFWIGERANISLHFLFGTRDDVTSCSTDLGKFTAGNLLQINLYF